MSNGTTVVDIWAPASDRDKVFKSGTPTYHAVDVISGDHIGSGHRDLLAAVKIGKTFSHREKRPVEIRVTYGGV